MRNKWLAIWAIVFSTLLWSMQMIPPETKGELALLSILRKYKFWIAGISFFLLIAYHLYDIFVERHKIQRKWIRKFLELIVFLDLGGTNYHTRISVLCPRKGYMFFYRSIWYYLILRFIENFKHHTWKRSFRQIPIHLFTDYLIVYERYSYPHERKSYTYFRVCDNNGVAVKCYQEGVDYNISTSCISDIQLPDKITDLKGVQEKIVKKYMKDSYIGLENYSSMLMMTKRANNIYATPIIVNQQKVWGVLIIDNDEKEIISFKSKVDSVIERYIKLFVFTINHLKMK